MNSRNYSIDVLRCIAAILITNSHMDILYGKYSSLATGGAIGDALYFFISGYTLLRGADLDFFSWYKRRINRIYPSIFAWALVTSVFSISGYDTFSMKDILLQGGGWFISCIMIYYVVIWFVKRFAANKLIYVVAANVIFVLLWYFIFGLSNSESYSIYGDGYFKWGFFFIYMLIGAICGRTTDSPKIGLPVIGLIFCTICFYWLCSFMHSEDGLNSLQLLSLIPLAGICCYLYWLCCTPFVTKIFNNRFCGPCIRIIGSLCLEIYLVQGPLISDKLNGIFPLNLFITFAIILCAAYLLRCLARIWSQTFKESNYNFKEIFKLL